MAQNSFNLSAYVRNQPEVRLFNAPQPAKRDPGNNDRYAIGQLWINISSNAAFVLTSYNASGNPVWSDITGGGAVFSSLTVNPGPTNLSTVGNGAVSIGNSTNTGAITLTVGTGNMSVVGGGNSIFLGTDAAANTVSLGSTTAGALTTISGGNGTGIGSAAILVATATAGDIQIGTSSQTGAIYISPSTAGNITNIASGINVGAQTINIANGATGANSTVHILSGVGTAGAGTLQMANNTRVSTIDLGNIAPAAARTTTICGGNSAQSDTLNILNGNPSASTQAVSILSGTPTGGTQTLNLGNQVTNPIAINIGANTGLATIGIGSGAAANVVTLGSTNGAAQTIIQAGTAGLSLSAAGKVSMVPATTGSPVASPTAAVTNNNRVGSCIFTGFTTAASGTQTFTITNSTVSTSSAIFCTVSHVKATNSNVRLTLEDVEIAAAGGSFLVKTTNLGADALDGNVIINWWVLS